MPYPTGILPILPLRNTVVFAGVSQMISVGRSRSVAALRKAREQSREEGQWILTVAQRHQNQRDDFKVSDLYDVGTLCKIESVRGSAEQGFQVLLRGVQRVRLSDVRLNDDYFQGLAERIDDIVDANETTLTALFESVKKLSKEILQLIPANTDQIAELISGIEDLSFLTSIAAANIEMDHHLKQEILAEPRIKERTMRLLQVMQDLKESLTIQSEIRSKLSSKLGEAHRQSILREQMKTIREELGEGEDVDVTERYSEKLAESGMSDEAQKVFKQELKRLSQINQQSPEYHVICNYLDLMCDLPWNKSAPEMEIDLELARQVLDADHYGLQKVKKRILQHLAVMKLKKSTKGTIILLVGPPGVGKTSLGQSIASALGRKFARVSLGGVRDDAEIRGHRRTYIGSMPGRIISALKRAGENNPVLMFDEIDKMASSFQGDPASAMLEVLDPEQNKNFVDHYLDVGFDLSKVIFIATANTLDSIPIPLIDRMEIIEVPGYTVAEKMHIAKAHLLPKEMQEHGMEAGQLSIGDDALLRLITAYTREAGVRDLRRKIAEVCRGTSEKVLKNGSFKLEITDLEEILGPERFIQEIAETAASTGVVTGLAWTPVGGDILFIETTLMPGTGQLTITGQLGEVMKESAQIGLSLLRSRLSVLAPEIDFKKFDVHVHVPAGAIPKDGPSAGVTMLTSLASAFSKRKVNSALAMTGEITLRGAVTPVGGIREKVMAAQRAGIREVILPKRNEKDLREIPEEIRSQIQIHLVDHINQVLKIALHLKDDFLAPDGGEDLHEIVATPAALPLTQIETH